MSKIFITGSSDGLGLRSAQTLAKRGHSVYLHARNDQRATDARRSYPQEKCCLVADLTSTDETKALASQLNESGPCDAIIHNAGIMHFSRGQPKVANDFLALFAVNTMAPYLLTCLIDPPPKRYVFLSAPCITEVMHHCGTLSSVATAIAFSTIPCLHFGLQRDLRRKV